MSRIFPAILILVFSHLTEVLAQESPPDSLSVESVQLSRTLDNGMQVVVKSMPDAALVRVGVFFAAGSVVEPDSLAGLAHLSEHLLTESSLNYPDGEMIRRRTLFSTYRNAYTGSAFMQFDTECLPVFLSEVLELEADRFRGVMTDSVSFEREKRVVLEELALRKRLPPTQEFLESVFHACYSGHPFGRDVGGSAATVQEIRMADFLKFQEQYIRPEKSAIVVKGPLDPDQTMAEIERVFGSGPPRRPEFLETPPYPPITSTQIIADSHDHTGLMVCLAFRVSLHEEMDHAFVSVLPGLLEESSLHPRVSTVPGEAVVMLVYRGKYSRPSTNLQDHWGTIYHEFDPEQQSLRYMGYQWDEIYDLVLEFGDPDVFEEHLDRALDDLDGKRRNPGRSGDLGTSLVNGNEYLTRDRIREILESAAPEDFARFMGRWINPDQVVVGISHGRDSERSAAIHMTKSTRAAAPMGAESALESLTQAQIEPVLQEYGKAGLIQLDGFELDNGIPVFNLLIPDSDHWTMAGFRTFKGIKDMRPGKKPGLAQIFNLVVNYDDKQRRDPDREMPPKPLPHDLAFHLGWNSAGFFAQGPAEKMDDIITTIEERISSREFNSIRWYSVTLWGDDYLRSILNRKINVARAWRWKQIFGPKHPSLGMWAPEPESFRKVKYKDLSKLHKDYVQKTGNLELFVAGGKTEDQVKPLLNRTFGHHDSWRSREPEDVPETNIQGIRGKIIPDLTRGDVMLQFSFPLCHPETGSRPTTTVLALECALDQILTERLREQEGLTYGVSTRMYAAAGNQLWEISVTCQPGQSQTVFPIIREELARVTGTGFTADEIARARLDLTGQAIRNFSDQASGLAYLQRLAEIGKIPLEPLEKISAVTTAEVIALARSAIDSGNFVFTATGPLFEEDIEKFDIH